MTKSKQIESRIAFYFKPYFNSGSPTLWRELFCFDLVVDYKRHSQSNVGLFAYGDKEMNKCSVESCQNKLYVKGFCQTHYKRNLKYGSPHVCKINKGIGSTPEQKFWSKVAITANPNKCWEWQGSTTHGYGVFGYNGKLQRAHRLSFLFIYGRHSELFILHSCDNRKCVNPSHLREGSQAENMSDKVSRARQIKGSKISNSILKEVDIPAIKQQLSEGISFAKIGRVYGVKRSTIQSIRAGKSWGHIQ